MKKRWIILVLLIPILLVLGFRLYVMTHSSDIAPVDDSDLLLVRPDVPVKNNAYQVFTNAIDLLYVPEEYDLAEYLWCDSNEVSVSQEQITELLNKNKMLIAMIDDGVQREFCFRETLFELDIPIRKFLDIHLVLLAKIKELMDDRKFYEALDIARISLRFGYLVEKDAECFVEALAGITMLQRSLICIDELTNQYNFTQDQMSLLIKDLSKMKDLRIGMESSYRGQYSYAINESLDLIDSISKRHKSSSPVQFLTGRDYAFKPNTTKKVLAEYWRRQIYNLKNPDHMQEMQYDSEKYRVPNEFITKMAFLFDENSIGKIFLSLNMLSDLSDHHEEVYKTEKMVSGLKTKLLLRQQKIDNL